MKKTKLIWMTLSVLVVFIMYYVSVSLKGNGDKLLFAYKDSCGNDFSIWGKGKIEIRGSFGSPKESGSGEAHWVDSTVDGCGTTADIKDVKKLDGEFTTITTTGAVILDSFYYDPLPTRTLNIPSYPIVDTFVICDGATTVTDCWTQTLLSSPTTTIKRLPWWKRYLPATNTKSGTNSKNIPITITE